MLTKLFRKTKYYYIGYIVHIDNSNIYGTGTFITKGKPDLQKYIAEIHEFNRHEAEDVVIISCIECRSDFLGGKID